MDNEQLAKSIDQSRNIVRDSQIAVEEMINNVDGIEFSEYEEITGNMKKLQAGIAQSDSNIRFKRYTKRD